MRKRRIVAICIFATAVVLVTAICIHQVKNVKENEDENYLLGIEGIKEANVSIAMNGDDIKPLYENAEITLNVLN